MNKQQKGEIADKLLGLDLKEVRALNRALGYYMKKFRGKYNMQHIYTHLKNRERVKKHLSNLNEVERNIIEVVIEGYDKGILETHPWTLISSVPIHNDTYRYFNERFTNSEAELLIGALAMYRATPGIAKKYKKECIELRTKIFGGVIND